LILTIPIFFGVYLEYFTIRELDWLITLMIISGLFILLILDKILVIFGYNRKIIEGMQKNDVIKAFIDGNSKEIIWFYFPIIIITEELIFRYYTIGFLDYTLELEPIVVIFLSSLFFSIYHLHIWFRYKNLMILLVNIGYPFLMGLYISYIFLHIGIIPCIFVHFFLALYGYYNTYRYYFHN
jgi:hypothetical protein